MGISLPQPGAAVSAARAGSIIGKAERAKEERARAEREQVRKQQEKAAEKARQIALDWDIQKMQINSQRAFERELRQEDYKLAAEDRAEAWQIEKMELASRMDFERTEGERQRKLGVIDAKRTAMEKTVESGQFTGEEFEYQVKMEEFDQQYQAIETGIPYRPMSDQERMMLRLREPGDSVGDGSAGGMGASGIPIPDVNNITVRDMEAINATGKTYIVEKSTNTLMEVPRENAAEAVAKGTYKHPIIIDASKKTPRWIADKNASFDISKVML